MSKTTTKRTSAKDPEATDVAAGDGGSARPAWRTVKRVAICAAALITAWHLFATFLWVAPASQLRTIVPGQALERYMIPMFGQSWSVFAPEPINGDYYFDVRAVLDPGDGTEPEVTEWIRASDVEQSHSRYRLFPPRSSNLAVSQASALKSEWDSISEDHRVIVALNYFEGGDWEQRLEEKLREYADEENTLDAYLREERRATAYATQVALAVWGEDVIRVQYQAARQNVVPFGQRNDPHAERPAIQPVETGWRGLVVEEGQSQELFADYFCNSPVEVCVER